MAHAMNKSASLKKAPMRAIIACLAAAALGVLLVLGLAGCGPKQVEVPDLIYFQTADAEKALADAGLKLGSVTEKQDADIPLGDIVIEQSVKPGDKVDEGSVVDVVVTKGPKMGDPVKVPDLTGMTPEDAEKALADVLLIPIPGDPIYSDSVEPGKVCAQSTAAGTELTLLDSVTYNVSRGKEKVAVPDVAGKAIGEARDVLTKAGLGCDTTSSYSDAVPKDTVIGQSVKKDEQVDKGTVVVLEVSLGQKPVELVMVPNIISYNLEAAKRTLDSAGLKYTYTGDENGTVVSLNPTPGAKVNQGATVTFELRAPAPAEPSNPSAHDGGNEGGEEQSATISDEDARTLNMIDLEQVVWEYGLGELVSSFEPDITQLKNGKWYMEFEVRGADGDMKRIYAGTDDKVYEINDDGDVKRIKKPKN